jgi:hypothetical protein
MELKTLQDRLAVLESERYKVQQQIELNRRELDKFTGVSLNIDGAIMVVKELIQKEAGAKK